MTVNVSSVCDLARHGLYAVRLHYPIFTESKISCSCSSPTCTWKQGDGGSAGKHPVGKEWGKSATDDMEVIEDIWSRESWNVGIVVGPCHGIPADKAIIDIEDDTDEGREFAETLLAGYPAPSYSSGKSIHRLYRWTPDLPNLGSNASKKIKGLEFRLGGDGKQSQSVAPPSMHPSGKQYQWVEGMSLDDLPITPLPQHVIEYLNDYVTKEAAKGPKGSSNTDAKAFRSPIGKIKPGGRHHALLTYANSLWRKAFELWGINGIEEQESVDQVWMWLAGANLLTCDPPKTEAEVQVIFQSSQRYMLEELQRELDEKKSLAEPEKSPDKDDPNSFGNWLDRHGIRLSLDPNFGGTRTNPARIDSWKCNWSMKYITKGDQELAEIEIGEKKVQMIVSDLEKPVNVARRIQTETEGQFVLQRSFAFWDWHTIWTGKRNDSKGKNGITRGLKEWLIESAKIEQHGDGNLQDQVEDLILALAGNQDALFSALDQWESSGMHKFEGRLKIAPGRGELTALRLPEDPMTGFYKIDDELLLAVKGDEICKKYRGAYGSGIANGDIKKCLIACGLEYTNHRRGKLQGRWYVKKYNENVE